MNPPANNVVQAVEPLPRFITLKALAQVQVETADQREALRRGVLYDSTRSRRVGWFEGHSAILAALAAFERQDTENYGVDTKRPVSLGSSGPSSA